MKLLKKIVFILAMINLFSCATIVGGAIASHTSKDESIDFQVEFDSNNVLDLYNMKSKLDNYRGYRSLFGDDMVYYVLEFKAISVDNPDMIKNYISNINIEFFNNISKKIAVRNVSMIDHNGKILNGGSEIEKKFKPKQGSTIKIVYMYHKASKPYRIKFNDTYYSLSNDESLAKRIAENKLKEENMNIFLNLVEGGNTALVKEFVENNVLDIDTVPVSKPSAIIIASAKGYVDMVEYLISIGSDPYYLWRIPNDRPLINGISAAVYFNQDEMLDFYIEQGFDLDKTEMSMWTPLLVSAHTNNLPYFKKLIAAGADINAKLSFAMSGKQDIRVVAEKNNAVSILNYLDEISFE